jgi:hypothetical protein
VEKRGRLLVHLGIPYKLLVMVIMPCLKRADNLEMAWLQVQIGSVA